MGLDDGTITVWSDPWDPNEIAFATHSWTEKGPYSVRVKVKDDAGVESRWSNPMPIVVQKNNAKNVSFLRSLENYPFLLPILRQLSKLLEYSISLI